MLVTLECCVEARFRCVTQWAGDDLAKLYLLVEVVEVKAVRGVAVFEAKPAA
jgi:hypothetical protein